MQRITIELDDIGKFDIENIGKLIINNEEDWNISHLHFITLFNHADNEYYAWNLELNHVVSSESSVNAVKILSESLVAFVKSNIGVKEDLDKFAELLRNSNIECAELWGHFRYCDTLLAKEGRNLSSYFELKPEYKNRKSDKHIQYFQIENIDVVYTILDEIA